MHCSNEDNDCSLQLFKSPSLGQVTDRANHVPQCKACGAPMKPHTMFFDESQSEHYYRHNTIKELADDIDALIVVGTAL
jgi:NAD-dependent SIR2 family protein deacetylase